jgi:hypothetical protein
MCPGSHLAAGAHLSALPELAGPGRRVPKKYPVRGIYAHLVMGWIATQVPAVIKASLRV